MKLKISLRRFGGRSAADLCISADPATPIHVLADYLRRADPDAHDVPATGNATIALVGERTVEIPPALTLADAGLRSGATVAVVQGEELGRSKTGRSVAAIVLIVSGPDSGKKFEVPLGPSVIGRGRDCDIRLTDPMTSRRHARLHVQDKVEITDLGSANGVLIGDSPIDTAVLRPGESASLGDTVLTVSLTAPAVSEHGGGSLAFNRPPRLAEEFEGRTFSIPDPPAARKGQRFPIIPLFAPLLMGCALYLATKSSTSLILMAMSPLMMLGNVAESQLAGKRSHRQEVERFTGECDAIRAQAAATHEAEGALRRAEYPSVEECRRIAAALDPKLWSRRPDAPGFGQLRLGLGRQPSRSKIEFPPRRQSDPDRMSGLHEAFDALSTVDDVPATVALDAEGAVGVAGPGAEARGVARGYVVTLTALHSPAELAVYAVCGPDSTQEWEWLKWLPHCEGGMGPLECAALVASPPASTVLVGELEALIRARGDSGRESSQQSVPRLLVVVDDPLEQERRRLIDLTERGRGCGVWVIWVARHHTQLPACCRAFVEVTDTSSAGAVSFVGSRARVAPLQLEALDVVRAEEFSRGLSPVVDASARDDSQQDIPRSVSLLTLVGRDLAESSERVIERWVENRSVLTGPQAVDARKAGRPGNLRALIGETASGPHILDLRAHGPHALVGGTTGAGKSELLQSWIIAMALFNSPQRLTFLLVDYKGGSAFSECVRLPHTVGLVTDLSPHLVRRALTSLSAELRYREGILHRKRAKDLAALERDGDPEAPPSLVIVVDEFAALVQEVPEFVDGVVNVAQRGRSLGLHLILATQRPSGVIRENLRANTNLRIALRMADATDSTDVIGSKMAAHFDPTIPGRAASRTGPTALLPFQTGYVGGWTSSEPERPEIVVSTFGFSSKVTWALPADETNDRSFEGPTDIQRLVTSIDMASRTAEIPQPRKPWLSELAHVYDLAKLPSRRLDDDLVFAVADDPAHQSQPTIAFRPDVDGNMAIFGTGNAGKSTVLRTLCIAAGFTVRGGPCHVYALDFAARGLQMLEQLPHVGSIIPGTDVERAGRLLTMLREMIDVRATSYAGVGAGSISQYRKIAGDASEPRILLLVDGMGGMRSAYEGTEHHRLFDLFLGIAADGRQVGIHVVIAADRAGAVPSALSSLIQRRVTLRLAGENDYAMLGEAADVLDPKSSPGRGLCDGMEIQVAVLGGSPDVLAQDVAVWSFAAAMRKASANEAPPIGRLEDEVWLEGLKAEADGRPVFAMGADTLSEASFLPEGTFTVAGPPGSGRTYTLLTIASSFRRWRPDAKAVLLGFKRSALVYETQWDHVALEAADVAALAPAIERALGESGGNNVPGLVVIENIVDFVQSAADGPLQDMIKRVTANGHLVVSEGEPVPLNGLQPLLQIARSSRVGVVLQPEQSDGVLLRAQFPRVRKADFPVGRGLYVARGAQPVVVQVARPGSPPH